MIDLTGLNPPQRAAVLHRGGPLLVLAGAGSGKTRVITYRIAQLLCDGVPPEQVCALSFTNKAADELRVRLEQLVGRAARKVTCATFHALGLALLRAEREALGYATGFTIYDQADQLGLVRELLRAVHTDEELSRVDPKAILFRLSRAKSGFVSPAALREAVGDGADRYDEVAAALYPRYQEALRAFHAVDFDDLVIEPIGLLDRHPGVRARWGGRFAHLLVDEFQDTNRAQLALLERLAAGGAEVCAVGDDDQSIYGWRGAEAGNILEFERFFCGAIVVKLEENYRSTGPILACANAVIGHNLARRGKTLFTRRGGGAPVVEVVAPDAAGEARFVVDELEALRARHGYRYRDVAVLYRSNVQSRALEETLRERQVPLVMVGGQQFFERKEVKDVIAYLRCCLNPRDELSLRRIVNYPARGIGAAALDRADELARARRLPLGEALARAGEIPELAARAQAAIAGFVALIGRHRARLAGGAGFAVAARALVDEVGLVDDLRAAATSGAAAQRRIEHVDDLLESLADYERREGTARLEQYLARIALSSSDDDDDPEARGDAVTLTTLHGAKGLEFPVVFLVGVEEELLPHARTLYPHGPDVEGLADLSEERRLCYVGITRARERLYLTRARTRRKHHKDRPRVASRFLTEIPPELLERRELDEAGPPELEAAARVETLAELWRLVE